MYNHFLLLLSFLSFGTVTGQSQNVLTDPGFEMNGKEWSILNTGERQSENIKSGAFALKVSQNTPRFSGASQTIYFPKDIYKVEVSGWMKTENVVQGYSPYWKASIAVEIHDKSKQIVGVDLPPVGQQKGNSEWTYYKNTYNIPDGGSQIKIFAFLSNCTGTAWFDDLEVLFFNIDGDTLRAGLKPLQEKNNILYSKEQLQKDFKEMVGYLKTHPAIYEFTPKNEFDSLINSQFKKIKDSLNLAGFYTICSPVVAKVGCGHTLLNDRRFSLLPASKFFPLHVYFEQNKMYVIKSNNASPEITPGSEITEINGKPVSEIYSTIFNNLSADGYNNAWRQRCLSNSFSYFYALFYGYQDDYILTYKPYKKNKTYTCSFTTTNFKPLERQSIDSTKCKDDNLCFTILEDKNTAIITIKSFVYYDRVEYFRAFVDDCFQKIREKNISNLIFDHRDGGGGDPYCSSYLFSYLINKPMTYFKKSVQGYEELKVPIRPAKNAFNGKLYVLIDNAGGSTSGHLNALIKYHRLGIFIGQETAATYTCNASVKNFSLKFTKLNLDVAQTVYTVDIEPLPKDRGIIPDYEVMPSLEDIIADKDVVMGFAFKLIKRK